jgi:hypothetical protein
MWFGRNRFRLRWLAVRDNSSRRRAGKNRKSHRPPQSILIMRGYGMAAFGGGLNWSAQHSNLVAKTECGHEAATSYLLFCGSAVWDRWQAGEPMNSIGRRFDRESSSVFSVISLTGGIRPPDRRRAKHALSLSEREEISRWLSMPRSLRSIARHLGRSASTVSREASRNGGADRYRAVGSDQAAWDRAHHRLTLAIEVDRLLL